MRFKQPKWEFKWISSAEVRIAMAFKTTGFLGSWRGQTQKSHGKKRVQRWKWCRFFGMGQQGSLGIQTHKNIWISTPAVGIWPVTNHPISILCHWTSMVAGWECSSPPFSSAANLLCVWESGTWRSSAKWPYNALHIFLCIYYIYIIYIHTPITHVKFSHRVRKVYILSRGTSWYKSQYWRKEASLASRAWGMTAQLFGRFVWTSNMAWPYLTPPKGDPQKKRLQIPRKNLRGRFFASGIHKDFLIIPLYPNLSSFFPCWSMFPWFGCFFFDAGPPFSCEIHWGHHIGPAAAHCHRPGCWQCSGLASAGASGPHALGWLYTWSLVSIHMLIYL